MRINLVSDTVTKPTSEMLQYMFNAVVGDDVYKQDPTVIELESKVAALFGMEAGLFFPSGTMANQTAIKLHTQPGEQLIADKYAHVYNYEGGGVSFNSGVSCCLLNGHRGMITAAQVAGAINDPEFYHSPLTSLVCVENTTNKGGGACYELEDLQKKLQDDKLFEKADKLKQSAKNQTKNLEQLVELTKRFYVEKKAEQIADKLDKLGDKQNKLADNKQNNLYMRQL